MNQPKSSRRSSLLATALLLFTCGGLPTVAGAVEESFFAARVYPLLLAAECSSCHNDNGVASETDLQFPRDGAPAEEVSAFGLKLMDLVDRDLPEDSLLLLKPTNQEEHTGGERIPAGSDQARDLRVWVDYLSAMSEPQVAAARERIARIERRRLQPLTVRRLTHSQYNNTVRDLLGNRSLPATKFPQEDYVNGFKNQLESQGISPLQAEAYSKAAERLAVSAFRGGDHQELIPRSPTDAADAAAAGEFVSSFGLRAFRRPLADSERERYVELLTAEAARTNDFVAGVRLVVETMLQSPSFLFRVEHRPGSPLEQFDVAARLSYFIWNTMPGDELLQAAAAGRLGTVAEIEAAARQMLEDERARQSMEEFLAQWMRFDRVMSATPDRRRFGAFNSEVAAAMVEETRRLFGHLVWNDENFMDFFSAGYTFVSADLARLYGLPEPAEEFSRVEYPADSGRSGILGQGTFLVSTSNPSETSPTSRGLFIREHFLSQAVPAPPAGVNTALPDVTAEAPRTNRQRLAIHLNSEACSSCHRLIDPIGFGFEQYDPIGRFQEKMSLQFRSERYEEGERPRTERVELEIDTAGYIQGMADSEFSSPRELGDLLRDSETCQKCVVKQLFRYTFGRHETLADEPVITTALAQFRGSGFRFRELMVAFATSSLFLQSGSTSQ